MHPHRLLSNPGTQWYALSAGIAWDHQLMACVHMADVYRHAYTAASRILPPPAEKAGAAQRATAAAGRRGLQAIEADLEAFGPGRAAAHGGHGRLAEGERVF